MVSGICFSKSRRQIPTSYRITFNKVRVMRLLLIGLTLIVTTLTLIHRIEGPCDIKGMEDILREAISGLDGTNEANTTTVRLSPFSVISK